MGVAKLLFLLPHVFLFSNVQSRAVNISVSWTLPQEGFPHFFRYFKHPATWDDAKSICESFQGQLLTVENNERRDAARAYLKELDVLDNVWCGLERSSIEAPFVWTGGGNEALAGDGQWQQPNPLEPERLCAAISPVNDFRWLSFPCTDPAINSFVCQLQVPKWAEGEDGCLLNSLPSLTVTYLPEPGVIELLSDCGLAGTRTIACKGGEKQLDLMKRLSCDREEDFRSSTLGWTERSQRGHHTDTSTTADWANSATSQITRSWGTRHKRESGGTSMPTDITILLDQGEEQGDMSTRTIHTETSTPQAEPEKIVTIAAKGDPIEELKQEVNNYSNIFATIPNEDTATSISTSPDPEVGPTGALEVTRSKADYTQNRNPTIEDMTTIKMEIPDLENDFANEIPVIALEPSQVLINNIADNKGDQYSFAIDEGTTETEEIKKDLSTKQPINLQVKETMFNGSKTTMSIETITHTAPITTPGIKINFTPIQRNLPGDEVNHFTESTPKPKEMEEILVEDVENLATKKQEKTQQQDEVIVLTDLIPEVVTELEAETEQPIDVAFSAPNPLIITIDVQENETVSESEEREFARNQKEEEIKENNNIRSIANTVNKTQNEPISTLTIEETTEMSQDVKESIPIIVIEELGTEDRRETSQIEKLKEVPPTMNTEDGSTEQNTAEMIVASERMPPKEIGDTFILTTSTSQEGAINIKLDEKNPSQDMVAIQERDRPIKQNVTHIPEANNPDLKKEMEEKSMSTSVTTNEPKDTTSSTVTEVLSLLKIEKISETVMNEPSGDETENPKRPNRGRLFPHSNPLSFYPYFLNRVLG